MTRYNELDATIRTLEQQATYTRLYTITQNRHLAYRLQDAIYYLAHVAYMAKSATGLPPQKFHDAP